MFVRLGSEEKMVEQIEIYGKTRVRTNRESKNADKMNSLSFKIKCPFIAGKTNVTIGEYTLINILQKLYHIMLKLVSKNIFYLYYFLNSLPQPRRCWCIRHFWWLTAGNYGKCARALTHKITVNGGHTMAFFRTSAIHGG